MKYIYWKCTICGEELRTGTEMAEFDITDHFREHKKEFEQYEKAETDYNREVSLVEGKYPQKWLGYWIKNITDEKPKKPKKLWKCPKCEEEMTYHYKYDHQANASRKGVPYRCVPKKRNKKDPYLLSDK